MKNKKNTTNNTKSLNEVIVALKKLHEDYPNQGMLRHIMDATTEYPNLWIMSNKELSFALDKYRLELEMNIASQGDIDNILEDAKDLDTILKEKEDLDELFDDTESQYL